MNKEEKNQQIADLAQKLSNSSVVYLTDVSAMTVEKSNRLRRLCYGRNISLQVVKNTLLKRAMEQVEGKNYSELYPILKGNTSIMFSEVGNAPAKLIEEFRKKEDKPILKGAYIDEAIFIGDDKISMLISLKSKEDLIGDVIGLLQSPAKNVISALNSGKTTLAGLVKTLQDRSEN